MSSGEYKGRGLTELTNRTALRLAFHHMKSNPPRFSDGSKGSIVLVSSTSAYWGATGVVAYAASKHGVTGLLRSSQREANALKIRVNAVAPFFTPTQITTGFASKFAQYDINANTPERVGSVIVDTAANSTKRGACCLVSCHYAWSSSEILTLDV